MVPTLQVFPPAGAGSEAGAASVALGSTFAGSAVVVFVAVLLAMVGGGGVPSPQETKTRERPMKLAIIIDL